MNGAASAKPRTHRRTWRQDPEGRRARILKAGAREFGRRGFRDARMDRVAKAAGVAEGTLYHQFGSKQGLLVAVGNQYGRGLAEAAFGDLEQPIDPREIGTMVRNIFAYVRNSGGPLAAFLLASEPTEGGPALEANRTQMIAAIEVQLEDGVRRGLITPMNTRIAAVVQYGLVESALRECFLRRNGQDEALFIREVTTCLSAHLGHPLRKFE